MKIKINFNGTFHFACCERKSELGKNCRKKEMENGAASEKEN